MSSSLSNNQRGVLAICGCMAAGLLVVIYVQMTSGVDIPHAPIIATLYNVFFVLVIVAAIAIWPSRMLAEASCSAQARN